MSIINAIESYEEQSNAQLEQDRATALDYYLGKPLPGDGGIPQGRSRVVSRDVADSIEWIKPGLLRIFTSGDEVVSFTPRNQEDIEGAEQETDFINYIITEKNHWFTTAYTWFTDALISKNGYVKAYYEVTEDINKESYKGIDPNQLAMVMQDPEVTIIEQSSYDDPYAAQYLQQQAQQMGLDIAALPIPQLYDVVLERRSEYGCAKYIPIPPERTIVDSDHHGVDLWDCNFVEHWEEQTISSLREQGFDVPDDIGDETSSTDTSVESLARDRFSQTVNTDEANPDKSMRKVRVRECWIRYDSDDDGMAELHHVILVGKTILLNESADLIPIACLTPRIMPHRHVGLSEADVTIDIQNIKSALQRGLLDNVYFGVNGRHAIDKDRVNLDDMLTSRPAGIVRTEGPPAQSIMPLVHQANFQPVLMALEYFDTVREGRTGSSKQSQQLSPDALSKVPSGIAVAQLMSAQQAIVELMARCFAETGVKSLFRILHSITLKNANKQEIVRLRNKWVAVDPRQWKTRTDMTVSVGLGLGNREQQAVALERLLGMQGQMMPLGLTNAKTIHHTATKLTNALGFKDTEAFWVPPEQAKPAPAPQDPTLPIKAKELEIKEKSEAGKQRIDAFEAETNRMEAQTQRLQLVANSNRDFAEHKQKERQMEHGAMMDQSKMMQAMRPGDEAAMQRQEASAANQQIIAALQATEERAAARHEQLLSALLQLAKPKSRVVVRGANGKAIRSDEVLTETLQ